MKILIAASEAVPYAKTGGLADVTGSLVKEFRSRGIDASVILPLYRSVRENFSLFRTGKTLNINIRGNSASAEIWASERFHSPSAYFVDCPAFFDRPELYGTAQGAYPDNAYRFSFFSLAVISACAALGIRPDVIHCNDWQTALIPLYLKDFYRKRDFFRRTSSVFTIHNLGYQGQFAPSDISYTGLGWEYFTPEKLEFWGGLNFMKAGLLYSDAVSTVSETYASEILDPSAGFGLDGVLRRRREDLHGILNGIDYEDWNPETDPAIPARYGIGNMAGRSVCRSRLIKTAGLSGIKGPIFGIVGRLSHQKGFDVAADAIDHIVAMGAGVVVLGKGEEHYQNLMKASAAKYPGKVFVKIGFEEELGRLIYSGSDFFLMPSRYEPCGLGQLIALKYGSIPVARRTGGLADTIRDFTGRTEEATGFLFDDPTVSGLMSAVGRAGAAYSDPVIMERLVENAMRADFSWKVSAGRYLDLYRLASKKAAS